MTPKFFLAMSQLHGHQPDLTLRFGHQLADPTQAKQIQLRIMDNGRGFDTSNLLQDSGVELIGIRERTARFSGGLEIQSGPNAGTSPEVTIPLQSRVAPEEPPPP